MKPIRVALSGSGTKAPAHVGALQAIVDAGFTIIELAGTSGGALISALYACGMPLTQLRSLAMTMDWAPLMAGSLMSVITGKGYSSGNALLQFMQTNTGGKTFEQLPIDLTIMSSDVSNEVPFIFSEKSTPQAQIAFAGRASASIPLFFAPVVIGDSVLVDGGLVSNCPVDQLKIDRAPRLGIELTGKDTPFAGGKYGLMDMASHLVDLMIQSTEDAHIEIGELAGATIAQVPTGYASSLDKNMNAVIRGRLFTDGYNATATALKTIPVQVPA
jgi:NTE family protein